jgi:hypothetical protein
MYVKSLSEDELHLMLNYDIEVILELSEEQTMSILTELESRDHCCDNAVNIQDAWDDFNKNYRPKNQDRI